MTLHDDNIIRLWNTNDGRCILASTKDMLRNKASIVKNIKPHPGNVIVIGKYSDMYIVNVYKMSVLNKIQYENNGCVDLVFRENMLAICGK